MPDEIPDLFCVMISSSQLLRKDNIFRRMVSTFPTQRMCLFTRQQTRILSAETWPGRSVLLWDLACITFSPLLPSSFLQYLPILCPFESFWLKYTKNLCALRGAMPVHHEVQRMATEKLTLRDLVCVYCRFLWCCFFVSHRANWLDPSRQHDLQMNIQASRHINTLQ